MGISIHILFSDFFISQSVDEILMESNVRLGVYVQSILNVFTFLHSFIIFQFFFPFHYHDGIDPLECTYESIDTGNSSLASASER